MIFNIFPFPRGLYKLNKMFWTLPKSYWYKPLMLTSWKSDKKSRCDSAYKYVQHTPVKQMIRVEFLTLQNNGDINLWYKFLNKPIRNVRMRVLTVPFSISIIIPRGIALKILISTDFETSLRHCWLLFRHLLHTIYPN